jgi:hypothetical protein
MRTLLICALCAGAVVLGGLPCTYAFVALPPALLGRGFGPLGARLTEALPKLQGLPLAAAAHQRCGTSSLKLKAAAAVHKVVSNAAARTALVLTQWKSNLKENANRVAQSSLDYEKGDEAIAEADLKLRWDVATALVHVLCAPSYLSIVLHCAAMIDLPAFSQAITTMIPLLLKKAAAEKDSMIIEEVEGLECALAVSIGSGSACAIYRKHSQNSGVQSVVEIHYLVGNNVDQVTIRQTLSLLLLLCA